jgi:superfamily I DNA/RNA helicase/CRISPR/Cas system-associated exonuclease Cas4 (RecB family)
VERRIQPEEWAEAIADADGPQVVVAGPGAGKTEFLVRRALHLVDRRGIAPENLLMLSFSRRSARDLRTRVEAGLNRSFTEVPVSTFHSLAFRLLETYSRQALGWAEMPTLLTGPEQVALVRELLSSEDPDTWPLLYRPLLGTQTLAGEVTDYLLRCQEQLIDPDQLESRAADRDDWRAMPAFFRRYLAALESSHRIDYGTLQSLAVSVLEDEPVLAEVATQFAYILVDEYQDTTLAQARLLGRLYRPHRNLTVAGDPYQSIYSFRGAELGNVAAFPSDFPDAGGTPGRRLVLATSFRVPAAILDAAVRVTAGGELPGAAGAVEPTGASGSVETYGFSQETQEAEWIAAEIQRMNLSDGIPFSRMAVLVRSKRPFLPELSRTLEQHHIPHDTPDARLSEHPAVRIILDAVIAASGSEPDRERALRRLMLGPLFRMGLGAYRELQRQRLRDNLDWAGALRTIPDGAPLADLIDNPSWASEEPASAGFWTLWSSLPGLGYLVTDPARADYRHAWSSLSQVLDRFAERNPGATLAGYLTLSEEEEFEAMPLLGFGTSAEDRLVVTTLHQSKGLEFDVVFIADATEGVFPDLRRRDSLLGSRLLSPSQPEDPADYARFRLQEEMRLAYTAMCRASRRVIWTATVSGIEEGQGGPSRFLARVADTPSAAEAMVEPPAAATPTTPLESEAALRRSLRDPAAPAATRLGALTVLAAGGDRLRDHDTFAGAREPGPDVGLISGELRLSPSQADAYTTCPRRYVLERRLHVGDEGTVYLAFGTLIHDTLEEAEKAAADRGDVHASLQEALEALEACWDPTPYGPGPWSEAWHARAVTTLHFLYGNWPTDSLPAIALEHDVELEMGGVAWRGRVDRVEGDGRSVRIVDYKTSRSPASLEEAAESIQLGFYAMALADNPVGGSEPTSAQFWYPAKTDTKAVTTRDLDLGRLGEVASKLESAAAGIVSEDWVPRPGPHCQRCRVRSICPAWPEGREAFQ